MAGDFRPTPRPKNALDNNKFHLSAPNAKGKNASFQITLNQTMQGANEGALNPRVVVYTNDPDDTADYGKITAALDTRTFFAYLELLKQAATVWTKADRKKIDNKNFFQGKQRLETPMVVSSLLVGRDEDGSIWTSVSAPKRPNIKFYFMPSEFHGIVEGDGAQMDKPKLSQLYALADADRLGKMMANLLTAMYKAPPPKDQNGGGGYGNRGGGGNTNRGGGNSNSGGSSTAEDDDIPW